MTTTSNTSSTNVQYTTGTQPTIYGDTSTWVYPYPSPTSTYPTTSPKKDDPRSMWDTKTLVYDKDGASYLLTYGEIFLIEVGCSKDKKNRRKFEELTTEEIKDYFMVENL